MRKNLFYCTRCFKFLLKKEKKFTSTNWINLKIYDLHRCKSRFWIGRTWLGIRCDNKTIAIGIVISKCKFHRDYWMVCTGRICTISDSACKPYGANFPNPYLILYIEGNVSSKSICISSWNFYVAFAFIKSILFRLTINSQCISKCFFSFFSICNYYIITYSGQF